VDYRKYCSFFNRGCRTHGYHAGLSEYLAGRVAGQQQSSRGHGHSDGDPGGQTIATFLNTNTTAVEMGLLKVCKIAGAGIAPGENFTFMRAGASFTVPAGFCVKQGMLPVGTVVTGHGNVFIRNRGLRD